jgi:hypothetical protein
LRSLLRRPRGGPVLRCPIDVRLRRLLALGPRLVRPRAVEPVLGKLLSDPILRHHPLPGCPVGCGAVGGRPVGCGPALCPLCRSGPVLRCRSVGLSVRGPPV